MFTGGGYHFWWRLSEPLCDLALWTRHQTRIIEAVNSDPNVRDPSRVMRLPGFTNTKPGRGNLVEVVE
ncbi:MAG: hypothetical protein JSU63_11605 [Phycisphaerales bacterium]|nr:MAG: hypothetical protein JSU63_11605 [Phycisphaerales bacterium]